ncbi:DUF226 domain-containing protein [Borreliella burgdorferi]|uniref:DUF226 domain-containing protein n=1 Tax=Borreliella burgdorferi TaxID=139 RepID=UPI003DA247BE
MAFTFNKLKQLKEIETKLTFQKGKSIFIKVEKTNNKVTYHTKIMMDLFAFGTNKKQKDRFFIAFRGLMNPKKIEAFNLFPIECNDKFLGIYYGYKKPIKNVLLRYEVNGIKKAYTFSKICYIEFRFKRGSVFCYNKGLCSLLKKEKRDTKYYKSLVEVFLNLEKKVYEFYNKKFILEGILNTWIKKKQK